MEELRLIWKRKWLVIFITLLSFLIAGTINFRKYSKYRVYAYIEIDGQNKDLLLDEVRLKSMLMKGLDLKRPLKFRTSYNKEKNLIRIEINTGDPDQVKKRLQKLKGHRIGSDLEKKVTLTDKIFYTILFGLCALVMASVFVLVFLEDKE